jgi:periplasmic divalent cation tolerance protein
VGNISRFLFLTVSAWHSPFIDEVVVDQPYVIVLTTLGSDIDPATLALRLVEERLAACVNVLPEMESFFRWHGAVERDRERQLVIKTRAALVPELQRRLIEMHPYDLPEFLVVPVSAGSEAYLRWITASTTDPDTAPTRSETPH